MTHSGNEREFALNRVSVALVSIALIAVISVSYGLYFVRRSGSIRRQRDETRAAMLTIGSLNEARFGLGKEAVTTPAEFSSLLRGNAVANSSRKHTLHLVESLIRSGRDSWDQEFWVTKEAATVYLHSSGEDCVRETLDDIRIAIAIED